MVATPANTSGWSLASGSCSPLVPTALFGLQANARVGRGQFATLDSAGNAALNDGTVPGQISAGVAYPEVLSDVSSVAGAARALFWWGFGDAPGSTLANDNFTASDIAVPFYIADENTPGKLANNPTSGAQRSIGGLVFGLTERGTVYFWSGPVAQLVARAAVAAATGFAGSYAKAVDADAVTDLAEDTLDGQTPTAGVITSIGALVTGATLAASGATNFKTVVITKRDSLGVAGLVVVATADTKTTAWTQFQEVAFTLSAVAGRLNMKATDYLTIQETHGGTGAIIPAFKLRVSKAVI